MSGNGARVANQPDITVAIPGFNPLTFPSGTGGGCVTSGPFKNLSVNLGPGGLVTPGGAFEAVANPLAFNPRCLKRDLTTAVNKQYANASSIVHLLLSHNKLESFQTEMEGTPGVTLGVHVSIFLI